MMRSTRHQHHHQHRIYISKSVQRFLVVHHHHHYLLLVSYRIVSYRIVSFGMMARYFLNMLGCFGLIDSMWYVYRYVVCVMYYTCILYVPYYIQYVCVDKCQLREDNLWCSIMASFIIHTHSTCSCVMM